MEWLWFNLPCVDSLGFLLSLLDNFMGQGKNCGYSCQTAPTPKIENLENNPPHSQGDAMSIPEIHQDHECSDDGEVGGPMSVFWCRGHGHDEREFIMAVLDYCLDNDLNIPAIGWEDTASEQWQANIAIGDGIRYDRFVEAGPARRSPRFPITILDLERPKRRGAPKCLVKDCVDPWFSSTPIRAISDADHDYLAVEFHLCREHRKLLPDPSYRVVLVPVGATVVLNQAVAHDHQQP